MLARVPRLPFSLDPLIAEAKRRARRRRALTAVAVVALAAAVTLVAVVRPGGGAGAPVAQAAASSGLLPKQLTGDWSKNQYGGITVGPAGKVSISDFRVYHARFSRVTTHRLSISGDDLPAASCSGTGTYRWTILNHGDVIGEPGHELKLTKIHDACKGRIDLFAGRWFKSA